MLLDRPRLESRTPIQLLDALGLIGDGAPREKLSWERVEEFAKRRCAFDWLHLGYTTLPIGRLLEVLAEEPLLLPPRTGHMGNWEAIAKGQAGALDFNKGAATRGLGYPLIYGFNQTEDQTLQHGDCVYMPGSIVEDGKRTELDLYSWDGHGFVRRDRSSPLFTPFVLADIDGELRPLTELHWRRMLARSEFGFVLEASSFSRDEPLLRAMLATLIEDAAAQNNARVAFQSVLDRQASLDGLAVREDLHRMGAAYRMGEVEYACIDALVDAAMLPFRAVTEPREFFSKIADLPFRMPAIAAPTMQLLSGFLSTHYPEGVIERAAMTTPFNPHFHWGARDMAGYPPLHNGYFARTSRAKTASRSCEAILGTFAEADPLLFVLMPAAIFMLCPTTAHEQDDGLVADLITKVRNAASDAAAVVAMPLVENVVGEWLERVDGKISPYFMSRFRSRSGVFHDAASPEQSSLVEPAGFRDMSLRQACMTVGALIQAVSNKESAGNA